MYVASHDTRPRNDVGGLDWQLAISHAQVGSISKRQSLVSSQLSNYYQCMQYVHQWRNIFVWYDAGVNKRKADAAWECTIALGAEI